METKEAKGSQSVLQFSKTVEAIIMLNFSCPPDIVIRIKQQKPHLKIDIPTVN